MVISSNDLAVLLNTFSTFELDQSQMIIQQVLDILQIFDTQIKQNRIKFLTVQLVKLIFNEQPKYLIDTCKRKITICCLKVVLRKFNLQHAIKCQQLLNELNQIKEESDDKFEFNMITMIFQTICQGPTPYDFLYKIQQNNLMNAKSIEQISNIISFSLALPQTFEIDSQYVFFACLSMYYNQNQLYGKYSLELDSQLTNEIIQLRKLIQQALLQII